jgi:hypothetical protein
MSGYCTISSSSRRSCFPNSRSAKDFQRTRCSVHTMIYSPELESMQTMIADTHEYCSRLVACGVQGRCTRSSKKFYREWELRSNLITRMMRMMKNPTASPRTPNIASRLQPQTNYRTRTRRRTHTLVRGATPKARLGMVETISDRSIEKGVTLPLLLRRPTTPTTNNMLCTKPDRPVSNSHCSQRIFKARSRMVQNITLEPG